MKKNPFFKPVLFYSLAAVMLVGVPLALAHVLNVQGAAPASHNEYTGTASGAALVGVSTGGAGVTIGVQGESNSPANGSTGVYGLGTAATGDTYGVYGESNSSGGIGAYGTSPWIGVRGYVPTINGLSWGVLGRTESSSGRGVAGYAFHPTGVTYAVTANVSSPNGWGVYVLTPGGGTGGAGYFGGNVTVTGTLTKGAGAFKIDHPQDPANKYLQHSFVESPDMMNIYNGNIKLDENGEATVTMPDYFEALNMDFRYQLTALGASAPGLFIAEEIDKNTFKVAGGKAGVKVSWQVTGIRQDATAKAHRIQVVMDKPAGEKGTYLDPLAHGQPLSKGVNYAMMKDDEIMETPKRVEGEKVASARGNTHEAGHGHSH